MDTTIIIIVAIAALFIILYLLTRRPAAPPISPPGPTTPPATIETFDPEDNRLAGAVNRRTTIVAPAQNGHQVEIGLDQLVGPPGTPPPPEKGLGPFVIDVINPRFTDGVTKELLTQFSPPLTFTVNYTTQDMGAMRPSAPVNAADDSLHLVTYYLAKDGWHFEKLDTTPDPVAMTLTASVSTLTPADPIGIWH